MAVYAVIGLFIFGFSQINSLLLSEPRVRCTATATARGDCHFCMCNVQGEYQCREHPCNAQANGDEVNSRRRECEPHHIYRDSDLFCTCNAEGFWKSTNCRVNFRHMTGDSHTYSHYNYRQDQRLNVQCKPRSLYLIDCNVCECGDKGSLSSCTNRLCKSGSKIDACNYGDILRTSNELCSCSDINLYIDRLCFQVQDKAIQEIDRNDVDSIIEIGKSWVRTHNIYDSACVPRTVIRVDCNRCICTETGVLACTDKHCVVPYSIYLRASPQNEFQSLPRIESLDQPCRPGTIYRYKCNTCVCTKKEVFTCTTMICLSDVILDKNSMGTKLKKYVAW